MTNGTKRERGTGRIFLRGQVFWCQYYVNGVQRRGSTGETDEKRAGKYLRKCIGEVAAGIVHDSRGLRFEDLRDMKASIA